MIKVLVNNWIRKVNREPISEGLFLKKISKQYLFNSGLTKKEIRIRRNQSQITRGKTSQPNDFRTRLEKTIRPLITINLHFKKYNSIFILIV